MTDTYLMKELIEELREMNYHLSEIENNLKKTNEVVEPLGSFTDIIKENEQFLQNTARMGIKALSVKQTIDTTFRLPFKR